MTDLPRKTIIICNRTTSCALRDQQQQHQAGARQNTGLPAKLHISTAPCVLLKTTQYQEPLILYFPAMCAADA
jgi:hypothetical protein